MNKQQYRFYTTFVDHLADETGIDLFVAANLADKLHRAESTLHRLSENACNGWPTYDYKEDQAWRERDEKKEARTEQRVRELLSDYPTIRVSFQGDPRGCIIRLYFDRTKWHNSFDGESVVIDW
jgi:hypothetical protein